MTHYIINPVQQQYYMSQINPKIPKPPNFYKPAERISNHYGNPTIFNKTPLSEEKTLRTPTQKFLSPRNPVVFSRTEPKSFLSPHQKLNTNEKQPIDSENVDDIVAKCLSRTQKLIEGIKKVKKTENSTIQNEKDKNTSLSIPMTINLPTAMSPFKQKNTLSPYKKNSLSPGKIILSKTTITNRASPSKIVINPVIVTNSPIKVLQNTSIRTSRHSLSPSRIMINQSQGDSPSVLSLSYVFINPIYVEHEIESYSGDICENKPHGRGICIYKNGYKYEGEFEMGVKHGFGVITNPEGEEVYCGDWELGKFHGDGILVNPDYDESTATQEINYKDLSHFHNVWVKYEGSFSESKMNDLGTLYLKNGDKFAGKFLDGVINGEGSYYRSNGDEPIMGSWENGKLILVF